MDIKRRRAAVALDVTLAVAGLLGLGTVAVLYAFNPVSDEWHCVDGKAPARHRAGGGDCFRQGSQLPEGWRWERWGNRPMVYSCDQDDWIEIVHRNGNHQDCVREGTDLPPAWRPVRR